MTGWGPFDISGKNVIVTGAANGIGFGIAKAFVEGGANVLIADLDADAAKVAAQRLSEGPGKVASIGVNVAIPGDGSMLVNLCKAQFGSVDVLVNNAGIYPFVPMMQATPEHFDQVIGVNLKGTAFCAQAAAAEMIKQNRGGQIINIASIDGIHPSGVGLAAYDSSKGGVVMFTKNFALEMAPHGIRVNAIAPGAIATKGVEDISASALLEATIQKIPMKRMGTPMDIAWATVFLASEASAYMTGEIVVVDGGMLLA